MSYINYESRGIMMMILIVIIIVLALGLYWYNRKHYHQMMHNVISSEMEYQEDEMKDEKSGEDQIEGFWYYPNCMESALGGLNCYPYYYYPYRRYYYNSYYGYPWRYYW